MGWQAKFSEPIPLPHGKKLTTLRDAAIYITKLPKADTKLKNGMQRWRPCYWLQNTTAPPCSRGSAS